mgnify:CR=1 FL=1|tara:strand:+ start:266 stop:466 length:201 start_codon:yes stop_codon:yes gene_type:complete
MKIKEEMHMDKRLVDRNIRTGVISKADHDKHIEGLPDVSDRADVLEVEMADVGVKNVEAKETGETE